VTNSNVCVINDKQHLERKLAEDAVTELYRFLLVELVVVVAAPPPTNRLPGYGKYTHGERLEVLNNLPSWELRRWHFDLIWADKIIFGYVDTRLNMHWNPDLKTVIKLLQ